MGTRTPTKTPGKKDASQAPEAPQRRTSRAAGLSERIETGYRRVRKLHEAVGEVERKPLRLGLAGGFLVLVLTVTLAFTGLGPTAIVIGAAAMLGGYMAVNIGANDVANSMGPPVGSKAISMTGALIIAGLCNAAGAVLAGGDVVTTIAKGIVHPSVLPDAGIFVAAMMSALLGAALWLNVATWIGAPVSTTHAIVGGVMGAGLAAVGVSAVDWPTLGAIAASWVISPVMGGLVAALFLTVVRATITRQKDKLAAARRWVPIFSAVMAGAFLLYVVLKGLKAVWKPDPISLTLLCLLAAGLAYEAIRRFVARRSVGLENRKRSVHGLFAPPLVGAAALLAFAAGANDVANAVGPLAAVVGVLQSGETGGHVVIPVWILAIGGFGIAVGLGLFGPRLVRTVGEKITKLNPIRAFCIALATAITVLLASALGLPVSSTHIAVGGVFGVGLLRETLHHRWRNITFPAAVAGGNALKADPAAPSSTIGPASEKKKKKKKKKKRRLVRRRYISTIVAAWLITVPLAAALSAALFLLLRLMPGLV